MWTVTQAGPHHSAAQVGMTPDPAQSQFMDIGLDLSGPGSIPAELFNHEKASYKTRPDMVCKVEQENSHILIKSESLRERGTGGEWEVKHPEWV